MEEKKREIRQSIIRKKREIYQSIVRKNRKSLQSVEGKNVQFVDRSRERNHEILSAAGKYLKILLIKGSKQTRSKYFLNEIQECRF